MNITVNGELQQYNFTDITLLAFLHQLNIPVQTAAIEHNGRILTRNQLSDVHVHDGDKLEVVNFVGGG
ncbi:MAG: sulfur carrier protein ThiS [bacterium]